MIDTGFKSPTAEGDDYNNWYYPEMLILKIQILPFLPLATISRIVTISRSIYRSGATIDGIEAKLVMSRAVAIGSCPYLYLKDGSSYNYYTDLASETLGGPWFDTPKYESGIYELGDFESIDGTYNLKVER